MTLEFDYKHILNDVKQVTHYSEIICQVISLCVPPPKYTPSFKSTKLQRTKKKINI